MLQNVKNLHFLYIKHILTGEHKSTCSKYNCALNNTKLIHIGKCTIYSFVHVHI